MTYFITIPSFPDYELDHLGTVRRRTGARGTRRGRPLRASPNRGGYPSLHLNGKHHQVHTLVAEVFLGPCPPGHEVNHKDLNKLNPATWNLEYVTRSENMRHAVANGAHVVVRGERNKSAKLTEALVREIRSSPEGTRAIARRLGVCHKTIGEIRHRRKWAHVA